LVEGGYKVLKIHMMDMFPQTFHLETVVVLSK
jgi:23S rRNA (uracil1939-C5)-methyltransferase